MESLLKNHYRGIREAVQKHPGGTPRGTPRRRPGGTQETQEAPRQEAPKKLQDVLEAKCTKTVLLFVRLSLGPPISCERDEGDPYCLRCLYTKAGDRQ